MPSFDVVSEVDAQEVRNSDGIHLSLEGARWMARIVGRVVAADHALEGP